MTNKLRVLMVTEHWIKEGKYALIWIQPFSHDFIDNNIRLHFFALADNCENFLRR